jgi:hypothetical protein
MPLVTALSLDLLRLAGVPVPGPQRAILPALLMRVKGHIVRVLTLDVEGEFIRAVRNVANPDQLAHLHLPPTSGQEWRRRS